MRATLVLLLSLLLALPAQAQAPSRSRVAEDCRATCNPVARELSANPPAVQACLIRCQAGNDFSQTRGLNTGTGRAVRGGGGPQGGGYAAIYVATPPNSAYGSSQAVPDRNQAHAEADRACTSRAMGGRCRMLAEARPGECVAAVQSGRNVGLVRTSDPRSFQVSFVDFGRGASPAEAEQAALQACFGRGSCEVVATACGSR
jgi:hypothetical protein